MCVRENGSVCVVTTASEWMSEGSERLECVSLVK